MTPSDAAPGPGPVLMWEIKAATGQIEALTSWVAEHAAATAQVFRSEDRVVVLDPTGRAEQDLAGLPRELADRPAHAWTFRPVPR
ncbi:hypothetical protein M6D93_16620 [Jatrophihabitans telluris]|uniref:Uncharacterized protein n=1 Tax=Jatrophihabitans telluris TaxID=2038343 RepID=A0ABY4QWL7_9ACTN|nr:hypothetical protein [Jatrophihabitans telluris]UQX87910.1 hypothetical protein M6D93_16620 [Jatrophihabitans telluris]